MTEQAKIPDNVFVHCPTNSFKLSRVEKCADCEFNNGLTRMQEGGEFVQEFRIVCACPTTRRLEIIDL